MTKKEEVKAKIQALVPEIMELKFGCEVKDRIKGKMTILRSYSVYDEPNVYDIAYTKGKQEELTYERYPNSFWKILGRPITLADVLLALSTKEHLRHDCILFNGQFAFDNYGHEFQDVELGEIDTGKGYKETPYPKWNLAQTYDNQPEEVYEFLHNILI